MKSLHVQIGTVIIIFSILFRTVISFTTGINWFGKPTILEVWNSDHYFITTCALYRTTITYLQDVYNRNDLESNVEAKNGACTDLHMIIATEIAKLNVSPTYFRLARQEIAMANIITDLIYDPAPITHFDNEEFENSAKFVAIQLRATQSSLERRQWQEARMAFGFMTHSIQDFYSHSNWIELGMNEPNRDLATGSRVGSVADKDIETCKSCNGSDEDCIRNNLIVNQYLTSGYFSYYYPVKKPPGKCNHGYSCSFPGDNDEYCEGINKDTSMSPHGHLHLKAASVAYDATVEVLKEIWKSTSTEAFGKFLGLSNSFSVVFVIDIGEHLQFVVDMIEKVTTQLVDRIQNLSIKPSNYILSPFNGTHWGPVHTVETIDEFLDLIRNLRESELNYWSINYYDALNEALKICESDSLVFFFTDAPLHQISSLGPTRALARLKQTKIDILFVNSSWSNDETINELDHFADTTGGLFITMNTEQQESNEDFIYHRLQEVFGFECILYESMSTRRQGTFMIDTTATLLRINVISSSPSLVFRLIDPIDSTFLAIPSSKSDYFQMFTIDLTNQSDVGQWTYTCSDDCAVEVNVKSELRCRTQLNARLSDTLCSLVATPPLVNQTGALAITTCDSSNEVINKSLQLIGNNGEILNSYSTTNKMIITVDIPSQNFRISTDIEFSDGTFIHREERALIDTSQIVMAIDNQPLIVMINEQLNVSYTIRNDANDALDIELYVDGVSKNSTLYTIDAGSTQSGSLIIDPGVFQLNNDIVRFIPLLFTLQAFKIGSNFAFNDIVYRHEQIVPLNILNSNFGLGDPTQFIAS